MSTQDERIVALERDAATMKRDIVYKLDETNRAVTIIKGVTGVLSQDVKVIKSQMKTMENQMKTMDLRLDGIDTRLARVEENQGEQGQGIREIKHRLDIQDEKLDQVLQLLTTLTPKTDE